MVGMGLLSHRSTWFGVFLVLFLGTLLSRGLLLSYGSIYQGEIYALNLVQSPILDTVARVEVTYNPPIFYTLAWVMDQISKLDLFWLRVPSALFSVLTFFPLLLIGRRFLKPEATLILLMFWALNPLQISYGQMGRAYSLAVLLGTSCIYFLMRYCEAPRFRWLGSFIVTALLALYTHYMTIFFLPTTFFLPLFLAGKDHKAQVWKGYFAASLVIGTCFLPFFAWTRGLSEYNTGHDWIKQTEPYWLLCIKSLRALLFDVTAYAWKGRQWDLVHPLWLKLCQLGVLVSFGLCLVLSLRSYPRDKNLRSMSLAFLGGLLVLILISILVRPYLVPGRYEVMSQPYLMVALSISLAYGLKKTPKLIIPLIVIYVMCAGAKLFYYFNSSYRSQQELRPSYSEFIDSMGHEDIFVGHMFSHIFLEHYLTESGFECSVASCVERSVPHRKVGLNRIYINSQSLNWFTKGPAPVLSDKSDVKLAVGNLILEAPRTNLWMAHEIWEQMDKSSKFGGYCKTGEYFRAEAILIYKFVPCGPSDLED